MHASTTDRAFDRFDLTPRAPTRTHATSQAEAGTIFFGGFFLLVGLLLWGINPKRR